MWALTWFEGLFSSCVEEVVLSFGTTCFEIGSQWVPWPFVEKVNLYGSDLREALVEVAHIFVSNASQGPAFEFITYLVQLSKILYSNESSRSPKQCLQLYNCTFTIHQLHCKLFGEALTSSYFHALLIHCPVQHELVCSRAANAESEAPKLLLNAQTANQRTCCQLYWSVFSAKGRARQTIPCQVCKMQTQELLNRLRSCHLSKVPHVQQNLWWIEDMCTRHTFSKLAIFWSWVKVFGGIDLQMGVFSFMMHLIRH